MQFSAAHPALQRALAARSYVEPTPVQTAVLAEDARGRDLLVSAHTGSGKTVAFGLAIGHTLLGEAERLGKAGAPRALVITPTRELAQQVCSELTWLFAETGARITTCVGGMDPHRERRALQGGVHLVVGTPGRLCDHLERGSLELEGVEVVVLDEADEMLDMGFREDLERLLQAMPAERRTLMFSATISKDIASLAKKFQRQALRVATAASHDRHRDIEYRAVEIVARERDLAVVNLLLFHDAPGALVFCATRDGVTHLAANLHERGFAAVALSGELSQRERNSALQALRDGRARVCVATDVAARGLDLPDLGIVIHADVPQNAEMLVHRSGRTGRAGKHGVAILLVPDRARRHIERLLHSAHVDVSWSKPPQARDIRSRDQDRLVTEIGTLAANPNEDDVVAARALLATHSAEQLVAALVRVRREARPAPEELTVVAPARPARGPGQRADRGPDRRPERGPDRRGDRGDRGDRGGEHRPVRASDRDPERNYTWFTLNVGRMTKADPKWLIPLLCRRGNITKREIGKIEIQARDTRVEIANDAVDAFSEALLRPDKKDRQVRIARADR